MKRQKSDTLSDNEWQRVVQRMAASDSEWQRVIKRMTTSGTTCHRVTTDDNE